ncbi:MAG: hypothetical protein Q4A41_02430 [Bacillota bacterium]|nr:hypothetical protein [Bacillota bacterium]
MSERCHKQGAYGGNMMNGNKIRARITGAVIKNTAVIVLLLIFLIYLGTATDKHIREYNDSLVEVRVILPGTVSNLKYYAFDTVVERDEQGEGWRASTILPGKEYYDSFAWKEDDRGSIRTPDGRVIEKKSVRVEPAEDGTKITFLFEDDTLQAGDPVKMTMNIRLTQVALNAVPYDALFQENNRYYFYEVIKRKGVWGDEYVIKRTAPQLRFVQSGYAYYRGYVAKGPIVLDSEAELQDGMLVKFRYQK